MTTFIHMTKRLVLSNPGSPVIKADIEQFSDGTVTLNVVRDATRGVTGSHIGCTSVQKAKNKFRRDYFIQGDKPVWKEAEVKQVSTPK